MRVLTRNTYLWLYTALALVTLHVSTLSYAGGTKPGDLSSINRCEFERLIAKSGEVLEFKAEHLHNGYEPPVDNRAFHGRVLLEHDPRETVFFHVENAILKTLNDKIFQDKELSAAILNLYKKMFFERMSRYPYLSAHIPPPSEGGRYSDFKTIRLALIVDAKSDRLEIHRQLNQLHQEVGLAFSAEVNRYPHIRAMYENRKAILGDPANWHVAGLGNTAAEASLQARRSRTASPDQTREKGTPWVLENFDAAAVIETAAELRKIESSRTSLELQFGHDPRIFKDHSLTADALDILRKGASDTTIDGLASLNSFITRRFRERFGVTLTEDQSKQLHHFYRDMNKIAPSIFIRESEPIALASLDHARYGVISFDFGGQNNMNMVGTIQSLHTAYNVASAHPAGAGSDERLVNETLWLADERQMRETDIFDESKNTLKDSVAAAGLVGEGINISERPDKELTSSGDDSTFLPSRAIGWKDQRQLIQQLRDRWSPPSRFRVTFQPQNYVDSIKAISNDERFGLISEAEGVEKKLRDNLEQSGASEALTFPEIKDTIFAIRIRPFSDKIVKFDVIFARGKEERPFRHQDNWEENIRAALGKPGALPSHFQLDKVLDVDSLH